MDFNVADLREQYKDLLENGIVPFWLRHGVDLEYGGVLSCMAEDGTQVSTDKYTWSQARFVWTMAALYNRYEARPAFLDAARKTIGFLLTHCRDENGWLVYRTTRAGQVIEGATSIYSDCFLVYGLSEYYRAVPDDALLEEAVRLFWRIAARVKEPDFRETAPYVLLPGRKIHGIPMILTEVANELAATMFRAKANGQPIADAADQSAATVMGHFVRPQRRLLLEYLSSDCSGTAAE